MCLLLEPRSDPSTGDDPKGSGTSEKNPVRLLTLCDDCRCQKKKKEEAQFSRGSSSRPRHTTVVMAGTYTA